MEKDYTKPQATSERWEKYDNRFRKTRRRNNFLMLGMVLIALLFGFFGNTSKKIITKTLNKNNKPIATNYSSFDTDIKPETLFIKKPYTIIKNKKPIFAKIVSMSNYKGITLVTELGLDTAVILVPSDSLKEFTGRKYYISENNNVISVLGKSIIELQIR